MLVVVLTSIGAVLFGVYCYKRNKEMEEVEPKIKEETQKETMPHLENVIVPTPPVAKAGNKLYDTQTTGSPVSNPLYSEDYLN